MNFPADDSKNEERHEYLSQGYLADGMVGRSPCVVRPPNDGGQI